MCGIAGIWNVTGVSDAPARIAAMLDAMRHRGPDGRGALEFAGGAAGMVRLALVDLSPRGQQPLWSADRRVAIVFNGEIYNFREERARLERQGHVFRTTTDTEVILNLYLERGLELTSRLRGMYAVAIFDWRNGTAGGVPQLVLLRGPLGIKPLYVAHPHGDPNQVVFASELRGLLASGLVPRQVDAAGLVDYLSHGFLIQPGTIVQNVRMLEPAMLERYAVDAAPRRQQFWRVPAYEPRDETLDEAAARLRATLDESVALHALADAPVGAFLSGGIDSTGMVGLMRRHVAQLHTYTLKFVDVPGQDEADLATAYARDLGSRHTLVEVRGRDVATMLPRFAGDLDQPSVDGLNTYLVSQAAARDVKGVLSGLGGDEMFAGYPVTRRMQRIGSTWLGRGQAVAGRLAHALRNLVPASRLRDRIDNLATRKSPLATWLQAHRVFDPVLAARLARAEHPLLSQEARFAELLHDWRLDWRAETAVGLSFLLDTRVYMIDQLLRDADAASMAHSLENRVPLVDVEVLKFSRTCPDAFKLRGDGGAGERYGSSGAKRVLIAALRDVLPADMLARPKRGFALPLDVWMQNELADVAADATSPAAVRRRGLLDPQLVAGVVRSAQVGTPGARYPKLWSLAIFELWCRAVLDPALAVRPLAQPVEVAGA